MSEPQGPFVPGQRVWDGDYLHEIVATIPGATWPHVYTRIVGRRQNDNVVSLEAARAQRKEQGQ